MAKEKKTGTEQQKLETAIAELSLEELVALKANVEALIKQRQREYKKELYNQMLSIAQVAGFDSVEAFVSSQGRSPRSDKGVRLPPKYCNPADNKQTWSGKGRKPAWVVSHLQQGGKIEELEIA
ncbi:MAG: H-NS histone family protein [Magnetococcales bacterium]|nr:H-NS histone family protein [Magnetococcales bacterium]